MTDVQYTQGPNGYDLAYVRVHKTAQADTPTIVFLGGYRSDMEGTKALTLQSLCEENGYGFIRFDYGGHGRSGGAFEDGTISSWTQDTLHIIDTQTDGDLILVGSSMGGWIGLLCALKRKDRVKGLIGIAAAPDFTRWIEAELSDQHKQDLAEKGYFEEPNDYSDEPYIFTKALLEDGRSNSLLDAAIDLNIPVCLLQGMRDDDVPWQTAENIQNAITGADVRVNLIETADHRLSRDEDLACLGKELKTLIEKL